MALSLTISVTFYHVHLLYINLDISWAITAESLSLHGANRRTRTITLRTLNKPIQSIVKS